MKFRSTTQRKDGVFSGVVLVTSNRVFLNTVPDTWHKNHYIKTSTICKAAHKAIESTGTYGTQTGNNGNRLRYLRKCAASVMHLSHKIRGYGLILCFTILRVQRLALADTLKMKKRKSILENDKALRIFFRFYSLAP